MEKEGRNLDSRNRYSGNLSIIQVIKHPTDICMYTYIQLERMITIKSLKLYYNENDSTEVNKNR